MAQKYHSGKYVGGHPDLAKQIPLTYVAIEGQDIAISSLVGFSWKEHARIPIPAITNVVAEKAGAAQSRVTMTRLLALGPFAFGAKKKGKSKHYVTVSWGTGKIPNETMFEFEGKHAQGQANALKGALVNVVNAQPT